MDRKRFLAPLARGGGIAGVQRHDCGAVQCPRTGGGRPRVEREQGVEPSTAFCEMAAHVPEPVEGAGEPKGPLCLAGIPEHIERGAEVVVLPTEQVEPLLRIAGEVWIGFLRKGEVVLRVPETKLGVIESFARELADRLEHPETIAAAAKKALVHEGLENVEAGMDDSLGGLKRAASSEDGEAREKDPLVGIEQVV